MPLLQSLVAQEQSLQSLFSGGYTSTSGSLSEWRALSGIGYQPNCNLQGFNVGRNLEQSLGAGGLADRVEKINLPFKREYEIVFHE